MAPGGRCVMTTGTSTEPAWSAGSWAAGWRCLLSVGLATAEEQTPSGWTTYAAPGQRLPFPSARHGPGEPTTAGTAKTPASCARVRNTHPPWLASATVDNQRVKQQAGQSSCHFLLSGCPFLVTGHSLLLTGCSLLFTGCPLIEPSSQICTYGHWQVGPLIVSWIWPLQVGRITPSLPNFVKN